MSDRTPEQKAALAVAAMGISDFEHFESGPEGEGAYAIVINGDTGLAYHVTVTARRYPDYDDGWN